jgi:protein-S-isoprenylcysteine O-methyltransferase Ste14
VAGIVLWNRLLRPPEEQFLAERFGQPYEHYRNAVRCWVPRWPPYSSPS